MAGAHDVVLGLGIEQNGARPSYWRIVGSWSRRPVRTLCG